MKLKRRPREAPVFGRIATGNWELDDLAHRRTTVAQNCSIFAPGKIERKRKICGNTAEVFTTDGARHIVYHQVPVLSFYPDGEIVARHNGFQTHTTARRISHFLERIVVSKVYWQWQMGEQSWDWSKERIAKECPRVIDWPLKIHAVYMSDYFPDYGKRVYGPDNEPERTYNTDGRRSILMLNK